MSDATIDELLAGWAENATLAGTARVYAALLGAVLLLPTRAVAVGEQVDHQTGLLAEKQAEVSVLTVTVGDAAEGRQVLPAFTTAAAMRRWRIEARPVPVRVPEACQAVLDEGWQGLVVDPGTTDFVLSLAAVRTLAAGFLPVAGHESLSVGSRTQADLLPAAPVDPPAELFAALRRALAREPAVGSAWLLAVMPGVEVAVALRVPLDAAGLATIAARLASRLPAIEGGLALAALDPQTAQAAALSCPQLWP